MACSQQRAIGCYRHAIKGLRQWLRLRENLRRFRVDGSQPKSLLIPNDAKQRQPIGRKRDAYGAPQWLHLPLLGPVLHLIHHTLRSTKYRKLSAVGRKVEAMAAVQFLDQAATGHIPQPYLIQHNAVAGFKE